MKQDLSCMTALSIFLTSTTTEDELKEAFMKNYKKEIERAGDLATIKTSLQYKAQLPENFHAFIDEKAKALGLVPSEY